MIENNRYTPQKVCDKLFIYLIFEIMDSKKSTKSTTADSKGKSTVSGKTTQSKATATKKSSMNDNKSSKK